MALIPSGRTSSNRAVQRPFDMAPLLVLDQYFRTCDELFRPEALSALSAICRIEGGANEPMDPARIDDLLPETSFLVAAQPKLSAAQISRARRLRAVIEVSGAFHDGLDYEACLANGIEVLSSMPGFRQPVAEMALAMILAGARGLVDQHEAFRDCTELWRDDRVETDFTLYRQSVGFVGYGQIARETHRLLAPFEPEVRAFDPWLSTPSEGVGFVGLDELFEQSRVIVVAASPTSENKHLVGSRQIARLTPGALIVLISRSHCVDFAALLAAADSGRCRVALDVFPEEPLPQNSTLRQSRNVILSPHRGAAVLGGRRLIGDMILHDVTAILQGRAERQLKVADAERLPSLVDAQQDATVTPT